MHIKLPEKMDRVLQYLKLKIFPNTLFFRTMLMIFYSADFGSGSIGNCLFQRQLGKGRPPLVG